MNCIERVVLSPGWRTIEPMVGVGGQHPSTTSIYGCSEKRKGWSPKFVRRNETWTVSPSFFVFKVDLFLVYFQAGCAMHLDGGQWRGILIASQEKECNSGRAYRQKCLIEVGHITLKL
jgi:hypothetical protein